MLLSCLRVAAPLLLALPLLLTLAQPASAKRQRKPKTPPVPAAAPEKPQQTAPTKRTIQPAPRIPLQRNLRFVLRPTLLGLVPPPDPLDMGEAFVRVLGVDNTRLVARYEIKEQVVHDPATGKVYPLSAAPADIKTKPLLRIRRGDVEARRQDAEPEIVSPLFWTNGNWRTPTGLVWLGATTLATLKAGGQPAWQLHFPDDGPDDANFKQIEAARRSAAGLTDQSPLSLKLLPGGAGYRCLVNGATVDLPAVRAMDTLLLAEYWFLDDPENPLLLKMNYLPLAKPDPSETGWSELINSGGGFAVTEIDF